MKTLLLFLFGSGFQFTTGKVTVVQTCPKTKTAWDHRSSIFTCEDGNNKYHCVMTSALNLVEVCIIPLNITGSEKGCPLVYISGPAAYWEFPFTSCPVQNTECPQDCHGGYTSEELYKYPSCFRNISERVSGENTVTQTTTETRVSTSNNFQEEACISNLEYLPYTTVAMFLLIGPIHVFILLMYWNLRRHLKKVEAMIEEGSKRISHISSSSIVTLPVEVMIEDGSKSISQISSSSSSTLPDLKKSDEIPLTVSDRTRTRKTRQNSYVPFHGKKDVKVNADSRKATGTTANYECPVEKDMKGKDVTPLPHSDTTNYANYPVGKDLKVDDDPPLLVSDARKGTSSTSNYKSPVQKDMKVDDDPPLPVSDARKGTSSTSNYKSPVQKDMKGNDVTPLPDADPTIYEICPVEKGMKGNDVPLSDSDSKTGTTCYANYPVQKDPEGSDETPQSVPNTRTRERQIMKNKKGGSKLSKSTH